MVLQNQGSQNTHTHTVSSSSIEILNNYMPELHLWAEMLHKYSENHPSCMAANWTEDQNQNDFIKI